MPKRAESEQDLPAFDLKGEREKYGYTQAQTATLLRASQASVARWEANGRLPLIYRDFWNLYWSQKAVKKPATKRSKKRDEETNTVEK
jgi:transcriptional regulator with XRE-family HTH domain